jgi:hypothetical protein
MHTEILENAFVSREVRKLKQGDLSSVTASGLLRGCCYQGCCGGTEPELPPQNR